MGKLLPDPGPGLCIAAVKLVIVQVKNRRVEGVGAYGDRKSTFGASVTGGLRFMVQVLSVSKPGMLDPQKPQQPKNGQVLRVRKTNPKLQTQTSPSEARLLLPTA